MSVGISEYIQQCLMKKQIVTVFMLTYKRPHYLRIAIESVLKQTYNNFYFIIIDNCSEDETPNVVQSFSDGRVIYIKRKSEKDSPNSKYAFEICKTKYLIILHDDDIADVGYLQRVVDEMESNDYCAVGVCADHINKDGIVIKKCIFNGGRKVYCGHEYLDAIIREIAHLPRIIYPTAIYRKSFYGNRDGFVSSKAGPAGDQYVWLQSERKGGKLCVIKEKYFNYRVHDDRVSSKNTGTMTIMLFKFLSEDDYYIKLLRENEKYVARYFFKLILRILIIYKDGKISKNKLKETLNMIPITIIYGMKERLLFSMIGIILKYPNQTASIMASIRKLKRFGLFVRRR